jgi:hypothetical protein
LSIYTTNLVSQIPLRQYIVWPRDYLALWGVDVGNAAWYCNSVISDEFPHPIYQVQTLDLFSKGLVRIASSYFVFNTTLVTSVIPRAARTIRRVQKVFGVHRPTHFIQFVSVWGLEHEKPLQHICSQFRFLVQVSWLGRF